MADTPDADRAIFSYRDAEGRERKGDPAELLRRLTICCGGDPNALFKRAEYLVNDGDGAIRPPDGFDAETSLQANERLAAAVCRAFKLGEPWNDLTGQGVPERVWQAALDGFLEFVQGEADGADGTPTSAPPSAPEASASPIHSNSASG